MKDRNVIYVYGTLRVGSSDLYMIPGKLYDLGWYPGLVQGDDDGSKDFVIAERLVVTDERLRELDRYEGYSPDFPSKSLYLRVKCNDGFVYVYNKDISGYPLIPEGDWFEWKESLRMNELNEEV